MSYRILLVDDEEDILEFMSFNLVNAGYIVQTALNGRQAIEKALEMKPHLILLDLMMPEMDGMEACRKLREHPQFYSVVIAFLSARSEDLSQIAAFEAGADDYITKPIRVNVLMSKIKALLKRVDQRRLARETKSNSGLIVDPERFVVIKDGKEMVLPRKEFQLLNLLYSTPKKVFSREEIFSKVWGDDVIVGDRTIDVHVRKLREKLGDKYIVTLKGVGYKFEN